MIPFPADREAIDIGDYYGDFSKIKAALGWFPQLIEQGLAETFAYYKNTARSIELRSMIRMNDFTAEPKELGRRELAAIEKVLRSGRFILDREVEAFEQTWAKFCGTRFCAGVGNGMEAIELGLRALDIGPGDEVITTPMTAMASVIAIMRSGATPVLADIDPGTALLNRASAERCLTQKTKAVLLVHLYGQISEMEDWMAFCRKAKIHLLEDCAQAHGANWNGIYGGGFATWGACSFYPTKNLGARGDAGAVVIHSEEIATRVKIAQLRHG